MKFLLFVAVALMAVLAFAEAVPRPVAGPVAAPGGWGWGAPGWVGPGWVAPGWGAGWGAGRVQWA